MPTPRETAHRLLAAYSHSPSALGREIEQLELPETDVGQLLAELVMIAGVAIRIVSNESGLEPLALQAFFEEVFDRDEAEARDADEL